MSHDLLATNPRPEHKPEIEATTSSSELEPTTIPMPEVLDEEGKEIESIARLLLERGEAVEPGTQIIPSPYEEDKVLDVTHYYGVITRLPGGDARYTVRAWRSKPSDESRSQTVAQREKLGLSPDSHDAFFAEQATEGITVVSSWNDELDGKPRKIEETLTYTRPSGHNGTETIMRTRSEAFPADAPESLVGPFVNPTKLSGEPLPLEDAQSEGSSTRETVVGSPRGRSFLGRAMAKVGIRRSS